MQAAAPIAVVIAMAVTGLIFYIVAGSAREIVKRNAPEYAQRLFTRGLESFFARSPVRFWGPVRRGNSSRSKGMVSADQSYGSSLPRVICSFHSRSGCKLGHPMTPRARA